MIRKYYLLLVFIAHRAAERIALISQNIALAIPKHTRLFYHRVGFHFRKIIQKRFCDNKKNQVDQFEYEQLQQKAEEREKELKHLLALERATLESTADAILMTRKEGGLMDWNQKLVEMANLPADIVASKSERRGIQHVLSLMKDPLGLMELMNKLDTNPHIKGHQDEIEFKDGRIIERYTQPLLIGNEIAGRVWSFRDITERKHTEEALRLRDRAMLASTHGIVILDSQEYKIIYANPAFEKITGYSAEEALGKNFNFLQKGNEDQPEFQKIKLALKEQQEGEAELRSFRKNGEIFWNELHIAPVPNAEGVVTHYVGIIVDISQRKEMEEQLLYQATHDALTHLPNRLLLNDRISQGIINARRTNTFLGVMFLDLDRFKFVNDTLGHTLGDNVLNYIAERLGPCIRETDTVARIGGDEFIFIITNLRRYEDIIEIAQKVLKVTASPIKIEGDELNLTGSIGISFYPNDGDNFTTLVKNADLAMYRAKDMGRDNFQFYTKELSDKISRRVQIEHDLREAIERKEFVLYYQPVISLTENRVIGAEALIRWNHPKGIVTPDEFISIAEDSGLIIPIGRWVLENACLQCETLHQSGQPLYISMNVSARQFNQNSVAAELEEILKKITINPGFLVLELTETVLMEKGAKALNVLKELKNLGIKLSIDDFGTGYSSFSYLYTYHIDQLKIDKSFVQGIAQSKDAESIILAILALAKQLNLRVVAEGVETKEQLDFLRLHGCDSVQGFYFSKPLPKKDFLAYLQNFSRP